ncbi:hypothetical protein GMST_42790 [Geomonas silvestris]|uniref:Lipoprotein n=1 Tax=Geomonas silvestris TaxID=2740184 RepID=A0A6V8MPV1_9BACT|nr:hypothetical protein [Geomonas silvestris]GFO61954.1 hypothetical protein GMST_42790 [Geomonas silvestris]
MRSICIKILLPLLLLFWSTSALAAVGCDLNNPDRDVPRLFPESTSFKTVYVSIQKMGGPALLKKIEGRLGAQNIALYAPVDVPYTLYEIYKDKKKVGYIHGVNQKGQFGGIQVFIAQDLSGKVKTFYLQKITGAAASKFREAKFARKFEGVTLKDFDHYDPVRGKGSGRIADVPNPSPDLETDYYGILRGLKKNLVLMDEFVFSAERGKP